MLGFVSDLGLTLVGLLVCVLVDRSVASGGAEPAR